MGRSAFARIGESRHHRRLIAWLCVGLLLALVAACGDGGRESATPNGPLLHVGS